MGANAGRNYGVTGMVDFDSSPLPPMQMQVLGFAAALAATLVDVTGPGAAFAQEFYSTNVGGNGSASGLVVSKQQPFPPTLRNLKGNITHQCDASCTITLPVIIKSVSCTKNQKTSDTWNVSVEWVKNGAETVAWNGTPATYNQPALSITELFADTQKLTDPNALTTAYTVKVFLPIAAVDGDSSTDAAGNAAVDAYIAAATAPRTNLKIVSTALMRVDDAAGMLLVQWGMKDSKDEAELARTYTLTDPNNLRSEIAIASVFTNGSPPSDPSTPSGLKEVNKRDDPLTPTQSVRQWVYGLNDSKDELERSLRHGTMYTIDANGLDSEGRITKVATSLPSTPSAPDSSVKFVSYTVHPVTDSASMFIFNYGVADSADRLQFSRIITDPDGLDDEARIPVLNGAPSAPVSPSGLVLVSTIDEAMANANKLSTGVYGRRSRKTAMQNDGSVVSIGSFPSDNTEAIVTIETCLGTDTIEALAQAKYTAVKSTTSPTQGLPFRSVRARRYHATAVIYTVLYAAVQGFVRQPPTDRARVKGKFTALKTKGWLANNSGTPALYVLSCLTRGSGKYLVQLGQVEAVGVGGPFTVEQRITGTSADLGTSSIGLTNASAFLGYPAGSVMYLGADYDVVIADTSSTYDMAYLFQLSITANWVGFPTLTGVPPGGLITTTSSVSTGLLNATGSAPNFSWSTLGVTAVLPATDAFSFFSGSR